MPFNEIYIAYIEFTSRKWTRGANHNPKFALKTATFSISSGKREWWIMRNIGNQCKCMRKNNRGISTT